MKPEFAFIFQAAPGGFQPGELLVVALVDDNADVHLTGPSDLIDRWATYFEESDTWVSRHLATDAPLSSLWGRSGYTFGEWYPYNDETKVRYDAGRIRLKNATTRVIKAQKKRS